MLKIEGLYILILMNCNFLKSQVALMFCVI